MLKLGMLFLQLKETIKLFQVYSVESIKENFTNFMFGDYGVERKL